MVGDATVNEVLDLLARDERLLWFWSPLSAAFVEAFERHRDDGLFDAVYERARLAGSGTDPHLTALLDELDAGFERVAGVLAAGSEAERHLRVLAAGSTRSAGLGFAAGIRERLQELERVVARASVDAATGVLPPDAFRRHLAIESLRCQRMELPLGLATVLCSSTHEKLGGTGLLLRENLRRYDGVGCLETGELIIVLPDVARSGLVAAVERLHRRLLEDPQNNALSFRFALTHFDCVDVSVTELLDEFAKSPERALEGDDYLCWA